MPSVAGHTPRARGRPFSRGNPGGPGRPAGSRNTSSLMLDTMAEEDARQIMRALLDKAKEGDRRAAEFVMARIWPVRKGRPIALALPPIETADDVVNALGFVANAVGDGQITPEEGAAIAAILESKRRAIEMSDLARRIEALEQEKEK